MLSERSRACLPCRLPAGRQVEESHAFEMFETLRLRPFGPPLRVTFIMQNALGAAKIIFRFFGSLREFDNSLSGRDMYF
jgi:hypothetical protein